MRRSRQAAEDARVRTQAWVAFGLLCSSGFVVVVLLMSSMGCRFPRDGAARMGRNAALNWRATVGDHAQCPTHEILVGTGVLDPGEAERGTLQISCDASDVAVVWAGPDRAFGTTDDRTSPDPLRDVDVLPVAPILREPLFAIASLVVTAMAIGSTLMTWRGAAPLRRCASVGGFLLVIGCTGLGFADMTVAHIAASRPNLSLADSTRLRARGARSLAAMAALGGLFGVPAMALAPMPLRSRARR
jgi:hypothetical protein